MIQLTVSEEGKNTTIVSSGDLGRCDTPIIRDPTALTDADHVVVESTYGGREHELKSEALRILSETVRLVAEHNGVLLVPSFAVGRTQDLLAREGDPLDDPGAAVTRDAEASKKITDTPRPYMVIASNGMLTGGRVLYHLRDLVDDPTTVILFVGYQGEGTLGAHLQAGVRTVTLIGEVRQVRCAVRSVSEFSAHADESELLDWVGRFAKGERPGDPGRPRTVFIVHGDPRAQRALEPKIRALGLRTKVPIGREVVRLD